MGRSRRQQSSTLSAKTLAETYDPLNSGIRKSTGFAADCEAMRQRALSPVVMVTERAIAPGRFLKFDQPHRLLVALRPEEVQDCLQRSPKGIMWRGIYRTKPH
jgi:hypothetical protein